MDVMGISLAYTLDVRANFLAALHLQASRKILETASREFAVVAGPRDGAKEEWARTLGRVEVFWVVGRLDDIGTRSKNPLRK